MRHTLIIALFCAMLTLGCEPKPLPPDTPEPPDSGSEVVVFSCSTACLNQADLGCKVGKGTEAGAPCVEVCENTMTNDAISWDIKCLTEASNCLQCQ